ncbi:MAG: hypothetical protein COV99_00030 [Bacteroidetes bacterium CG12_big_fil_rev_8_21_14_0_65_60_17]|nr:MAG: hypothetical protein COV99_00030 [Bacteroidetes bacterium CG12_big_fil_rev_8_21_14_0_65_60_17]
MLYRAHDVRDLPIYSIGEAAFYLRIAPATLRSWVLGRDYKTSEGIANFDPLIAVPDDGVTKLSFNNLVEAHVLRALRTKHDVTILSVRKAIKFAENKLRIERLLISEQLQTSAGDLFIEKYGQLINLSQSGQLAIKTLLESYLQRIERDDKLLPKKLYPFISRENAGDRRKTIVIDPQVSFGKPTISNKGITTAALVSRVDAGESVEELAEDYNLEQKEIVDAIVYEQAA